jgi:hypothetical protein
MLVDFESRLPESRKKNALTIVQRYADKQDYLGELLLYGPPAAFEKLFDDYRALGEEQAIASMRAEIAKSDDDSDDELRANAALALLRLGQDQDVLEFLDVTGGPERLTHFIFQVKGRGIQAEPLVRLIDSEQARWKGLDLSTIDRLRRRQDYLRLYGLILSLGQCDIKAMSKEKLGEFSSRLDEIYRWHPSRAVHSAAGWVLRQWGLNEEVQRVDSTPKDYDQSGLREWYVVKVQPGKSDQVAQYLTMLVFSAEDVNPSYQSEIEPGHVFALCDREVTWGLYNAMDGGALRTRCLDNPNIKNESALGDTLPVFKVNWIEANGLCNWLTQQTTFAQERAFRLPTTKEWRCAAAAGMQTAFCFGSDELFFEEFDWYRKNSKFVQESAKLPPSLGGLFDIHGNVSEWVTDASSYNPMEKKFHGSNWNSETNQGAARFESPKMRSLPDLGWSTLGFRIVQNLGPSQASTKTD